VTSKGQPRFPRGRDGPGPIPQPRRNRPDPSAGLVPALSGGTDDDAKTGVDSGEAASEPPSQRPGADRPQDIERRPRDGPAASHHGPTGALFEERAAARARAITATATSRSSRSSASRPGKRGESTLGKPGSSVTPRGLEDPKDSRTDTAEQTTDAASEADLQAPRQGGEPGGRLSRSGAPLGQLRAGTDLVPQPGVSAEAPPRMTLSRGPA